VLAPHSTTIPEKGEHHSESADKIQKNLPLKPQNKPPSEKPESKTVDRPFK
jgi:hypothetical protein